MPTTAQAISALARPVACRESMSVCARSRGARWCCAARHCRHVRRRNWHLAGVLLVYVRRGVKTSTGQLSEDPGMRIVPNPKAGAGCPRAAAAVSGSLHKARAHHAARTHTVLAKCRLAAYQADDRGTRLESRGADAFAYGCIATMFCMTPCRSIRSMNIHVRRAPAAVRDGRILRVIVDRVVRVRCFEPCSPCCESYRILQSAPRARHSGRRRRRRARWRPRLRRLCALQALQNGWSGRGRQPRRQCPSD